MADISTFSISELLQLCGKIGSYLYRIGRGEDEEIIEDRGPPKSILVELSWPAVETDIQLYDKLRPLIDDLLHRVVQDTRRFNSRRPTKLTLRWRRTSQMLAGWVIIITF